MIHTRVTCPICSKHVSQALQEIVSGASLRGSECNKKLGWPRYHPRVSFENDHHNPDCLHSYLPVRLLNPRDVHDAVHVPRNDHRFSPDVLDDVRGVVGCRHWQSLRLSASLQ